MKQKKVRKLVNGLYIVSWKDDTQSLAAVGTKADGNKWIAPCDWMFPSADEDSRLDWKLVKSVECLVPDVFAEDPDDDICEECGGSIFESYLDAEKEETHCRFAD